MGAERSKTNENFQPAQPCWVSGDSTWGGYLLPHPSGRFSPLSGHGPWTGSSECPALPCSCCLSPASLPLPHSPGLLAGSPPAAPVLMTHHSSLSCPGNGVSFRCGDQRGLWSRESLREEERSARIKTCSNL